MILSFKDILILPFEGQDERKSASAVAKPVNAKPITAQSSGGSNTAPVRKIAVAPTGQLSTTNIGIKDTLNPIQKKSNGESDDYIPDLAEPFTFEALEHVWKAYCLEVKRNKKDSLYSTLQSKMTMSSDYQIQLELLNSVQAAEIEKEKVELLGFVRKQLRNYTIGLTYTIVDAPKTLTLDSRGAYEKLAEENSSLNKFRKLFNLDIEF